jgi:hypothetical protein
MGYIGLLLNDPYKIDRMMGVCLIYFVFGFLLPEWFFPGYMNQGYFWKRGLKISVTRVLGGSG